jgi:hypothetical protein
VLAAGTNVDPEDVVEDVAADAVDDGADVALVVADETLVLVDERPDAE